MKTVKCLSILQPWASLCVTGEKRIETRSWNTKYRGELYIHASASKKCINMAAHPYFCDCLPIKVTQQQFSKTDIIVPDVAKFPFGAIIGKVDLIDVETADSLIGRELPDLPRPTIFIPSLREEWFVNEKEESFGDYSSNRFGWLLANPVMFDKPIPAKGKLGIWNYELEV